MELRKIRVKSVIFIIIFILLILLLSLMIFNDKSTDEIDHTVTVMTRNLYLGSDLSPIFMAVFMGMEVDEAIDQVYDAAMQSNIPRRAAMIAAEISTTQADLVGLQEVVSWTGPRGNVDFLAQILAHLPGYEAVAIAQGFDREFGLISLQVRDVILARTDQAVSQLALSNVQIGHYETVITFPFDGSLVSLPRQWASVDVNIWGTSFRFITTHLEAIDIAPYSGVRQAQAMELLGGLVSTGMPMVLVGDFNSLIGIDGDAAQTIINAGFSSAASDNTCCHGNLIDGGSTFEKQIDFIFYRGNFKVVSAGVTGGPGSFSGGWPSDHGGVVATLLLYGGPD